MDISGGNFKKRAGLERLRSLKANAEPLLAELEERRGSIAIPLLFGITREVSNETTDDLDRGFYT